jgi:ubiquinone/menaquinone biosynthesis C-methylase UbiE
MAADSSQENTYVIDTESLSEMARLTQQDRSFTHAMHGVFPHQLDLARIHDVLDIACGPGGWALDVAYEHPNMHVVGIDVSRIMIEYARSRAEAQNLLNAEFKVMDVLQPLELADHSFDFVNARTIVGFMLPSAWPELLKEARRVARPGGTIRLTELELSITNSPANEKINSLLGQVGVIAKRSFSPDGRNIGITPMLSRFLRDAGCQNIQLQAHAIDFSSAAEAQEEFFQNLRVGLQLLQPFLLKLQLVTKEEIEALYQQALIEVQSADFCGVVYLLSVWGETPLSV